MEKTERLRIHFFADLFSTETSRSIPSRFPDLQIFAAGAFSHIRAMTYCRILPDHSDRIVRDSHPVPFYPVSAPIFEPGPYRIF